MKKESIIAILFGVLLGAAVGLVLIIQNKQNQLQQAKTLTPKVTPTPASNLLGNFQTLEITSPADRSILDKNSVTITGKTNKDSLIIVQSPLKELSFVNSNESFSFDLSLSAGENVVKIVAYPKDKKLRPQEKELKIYYLSEQ